VEAGAFLQDEVLCLRWQGRTQPVAALSDIHLRGRHNVLNVLAACALSGAAGAAPAAMRAGLAGFGGVAHRLELVAERQGVRWYNDSIATAPERVLAALRSFDEPLVLLLGGRDKKLPWEALAALIKARVKHVVIFGEAAGLIQDALRAAGVPAEHISHGAHLPQAVAAAAKVAQPGDAVLLSPGGTSYDEFRDFEARGERFRELVRALG
jgi:UDP-N-acetylmuramoylalanine--D-glutamate ligase